MHNYLCPSVIIQVKRILFGSLLALLCFPVQESLGQDSLLVKIISVAGNTKTKQNVIKRELTLQEGQFIVGSRIEAELQRSQLNVYNLGLFTDVEILHEVLGNDLYIFITVSERWYIWPVPQIISEERNTYDLFQSIFDGNIPRLSYGLQLRWHNLTGNNDLVDFYGLWGFRRRFTLNFTRPGVFSKQYLDLLGGFTYSNQREAIIRTLEGTVDYVELDSDFIQERFSGFLGLRTRFSLYKSLLLYLSFKHYQFNDTIYEINPVFLTESDGIEYYPSITGVYAHDTRDFRSFPLSGFRYQFLFKVSGFPGLSTTQFGKLGFTWAHHLPLTKRWNFSYGTHHVLTLGKRVPYFDKSFIGIHRRDWPGVSTNLRGYEPFAIDGSMINMTKAEIKYALFPRRMLKMKNLPLKRFRQMPFGLYLTAFTDFGYVRDESFNNTDNFLKDRLLTGYGLGVNILTIYDYLIRVEFARNHLEQSGVYLHAVLPIK